MDAGKISRYFMDRNWKEYSCSSCGSDFYSKNGSGTCGAYACDGEYSFISNERKKKSVFPIDVVGDSADFFNRKGYEQVAPKRLINIYSSTSLESGDLENPLFISSGVQLLQSSIIEEKNAELKPMFVAQPSIRTNYADVVDERDGVSTSFINICTERFGADIRDYVKDMDGWLTYMSDSGLFVNKMKMSVKQQENHWFGKTVRSFNTYVNYGGLELGDAVFGYDVEQERRDNVSFSDVGFGAERLAWAMNGYGSYLESSGTLGTPPSVGRSPIESMKTAVLMVGSGIESSDRDRQNKVKAVYKKIGFKDYDTVKNLIGHYYGFWNRFTELERTESETRRLIHAGLNDNFNSSLVEKLNMKTTKIDPSIRSMETSDFTEFLIRKKNLGLRDIKEAIEGLY